MSFTGSNPVVVGYGTQKSHYDAIFDNTIYLRDFYKPLITRITSTGNQTAIALPTGALGYATIVCNNASTLTIQGIVAGAAGQPIVIRAINSTVVLAHENASASAANRLTLPGSGSVSLKSGHAAILVYDDTASRWTLVDTLQPWAEFDAGNTGTALTIDFLTNGPIQKATRNGNVTLTLTAPATPGTCILKLVHDATGTTYTVAFSPTPKWPNGTAFTFTNTANAIDVLTLYWDGATWFIVGQAAFA